MGQSAMVYAFPMPSSDETLFDHDKAGPCVKAAMCCMCSCMDTTKITKQRIVSQVGPSCRPRRCGGQGVSCSVTTDTMDLDHVRDVTLIRPCCCVFCCPCLDMGRMKIYGSDSSSRDQGQGDSFFVPFISKSKKIHDKLTEFLTKGQYPGFRLGSGGAPAEIEIAR